MTTNRIQRTVTIVTRDATGAEISTFTATLSAQVDSSHALETRSREHPAGPKPRHRSLDEIRILGRDGNVLGRIAVRLRVEGLDASAEISQTESHRSDVTPPATGEDPHFVRNPEDAFRRVGIALAPSVRGQAVPAGTVVDFDLRARGRGRERDARVDVVRRSPEELVLSVSVDGPSGPVATGDLTLRLEHRSGPTTDPPPVVVVLDDDD